MKTSFARRLSRVIAASVIAVGVTLALSVTGQAHDLKVCKSNDRAMRCDPWKRQASLVSLHRQHRLFRRRGAVLGREEHT
jgi:hypothetical protein